MNVNVPTIQRIMELAVLNNMDARVSMIEKTLGWSSNQWSKDFKLATGLTPNNYLRYFRMRCICHDLRTTGMKFYQIAESYERSVSYLTRDFRAIFGMTPEQFRQSGTLAAAEQVNRVFGEMDFTFSFSTSPPSPK